MQYKTNKTFEMDRDPECCENGFHFCENPLDTLNYYDLCDSRFAKVESLGKVDKRIDSDDTKIATNKIKIGAELDLKGFIKASFEFLWNKCKPSNREVDEDKLASSGYNSQLASSGYNSQLASSGYNSKLASSGYFSSISHEKGLPSVVCNIGVYGKAKGKKGDILVLAEYEEKDLKKYRTYVYKPTCVKSVKIDGKKIKENTYYRLENEKFVEV